MIKFVYFYKLTADDLVRQQGLNHCGTVKKRPDPGESMMMDGSLQSREVRAGGGGT
jgi:hypothetical protein